LSRQRGREDVGTNEREKERQREEKGGKKE